MKKNIISLLLVLSIFSCKIIPPEISKIEGKLIPVNDQIASNAIIEELVQPYKEKVEKEMKSVLSYTPVDIVRTDAKLESSLGNLMADLCFENANPIFISRTGKSVDFALFNYGGIRAGITKGNITTENAFQLMPFENLLVVVELSYEKMNELVEFLILENKAHPLSKQISFVVKDEGYTFKINNETLKPDKSYFVLTSDYLQSGGDNMTFFKNPISIVNLDYKVRNSIIDYFKSVDTVKVNLDGRFRKEN